MDDNTPRQLSEADAKKMLDDLEAILADFDRLLASNGAFTARWHNLFQTHWQGWNGKDGDRRVDYYDAPDPTAKAVQRLVGSAGDLISHASHRLTMHLLGGVPADLPPAVLERVKCYLPSRKV